MSTFPFGIRGPVGEQGDPGEQGPPGALTSVGGIKVLGVTGSLSPDLTGGWTQKVGPMSGAVHIAPPIVSFPGVTFLVQLIQDGTGGRTVTWDSYYKGVSPTTFVLDTGSSTQACLLFQVSLDGTYAQCMNVAQNGWSTT